MVLAVAFVAFGTAAFAAPTKSSPFWVTKAKVQLASLRVHAAAFGSPPGPSFDFALRGAPE